MKTMIKLFGALALVATLAIPANSYAALSADKYIISKNTGQAKRYLMKASTTMYRGSMCMVNSSGTVEPAAASASNQGVVGVAVKQVTSAASGDYYVTCVEGWFKMAGTTLGQDDVALTMYAEDDATIDETVGSNEPVAGLLIEYISASEGWVHISPVYQGRVAVTQPLVLTDVLTLEEGATIGQAVDNEVEFTENSEDFSFVFASNSISMSSDTGVVEFDFGLLNPKADQITVEGAIIGANAGEIDNDTNGAWTIAEASEDLVLTFTGNTVTTTSTTAVDTFDFGAIDVVGNDIELDGTFTVLGSGATIGWTIANAANTACTTTCAGTGSCVVGFDAGTTAFVACASALADTCTCAGPAS
jgi:hypothetical protein